MLYYERTGSKNKHEQHIGTLDFYKYYQKKYKRKDIKRGVYANILKKFNGAIMDKMIEEAYEYRVPYMLGQVYIFTSKQHLVLDEEGKLVKRYMKVNWASTKELWLEDPDSREKKILVYHFNDHFDRRIAKFGYSTFKMANYKNKNAYAFMPARKWKHRLAAVIKDDEMDVVYSERKPYIKKICSTEDL
jgi:hypothetical protein